jgi:polar amino acid transport system substrate-binding protein
MKKYSIISGLAAISLSAFFFSSAVCAYELPAEISKSKLIKIGVNSMYPPMEYKDEVSGKLIGFDIDLGEAIARELGVKIDWQDSAFEQLTPSLSTGRIDMILSGFSDTTARRASMDFIDYLNSGAQFYVLASKTKQFRVATDLCGQAVGTSRSTSFPAEIEAWSAQNCVAVGKAAIRVVGTQDTTAAKMQLKQGRLAGAVQGSETLPYAMKLEPNTYKPVGVPFATSPAGMAFLKSNSLLRDAVLEAMKKLMSNGTYSKIASKWGLQSSAVKQVALNGVAVN